MTLSLLASGWSVAAATLIGFLAGRIINLAVRSFASDVAAASTVHRRGIAVTTLRGLTLALLALGLRGGAIATAIALGAPVWLAAVCGAVAGWVASRLGYAYYVRQCDRIGPEDAAQWTLAAIGIMGYVVLLRVLYLQVVPAMPQEAYYWNYSIRPDLGYHDHPPMVAWLIAAGEAMLGHGPAGVRITAVGCGLVVMLFIYRLARRLVDRSAAMVAAALAAALPYFFYASGGMMTPDAPLTAAWAAALYFLHRALVGGERSAWIGVGVAMGLGMLSKYTIALLGPAALVYCLVDQRARGWLSRPQPYVAMLVALALFTPVVYWNYHHDWASFRFQTGGRFGTESRFSLHRLLLNMLVVATPLPFIALPLLFLKRWTGGTETGMEPAHADVRNRHFVICFVVVPLAAFAWSALRHLPRLNWTGPIWLAVLPLVGWAIVRAPTLRARRIGTAVRVIAPHLLGGLLVTYAVLDYYIAVGLPGVGYPKQAAPLLGWSAAARDLAAVGAEVERETGAVPVFVGMDAYQIASEISFYGTPQYLAAGVPPAADATAPKSLQVTADGKLFGGDGLMFAYWNPPAQLSGRNLIMVALRRKDLLEPALTAHFHELAPETHALPLIHVGYGLTPQPVDQVFYRIGFHYIPGAVAP